MGHLVAIKRRWQSGHKGQLIACWCMTRSAGSALMHLGSHIEQAYLGWNPIDFRESIDGLSALVEQELE